MVGIGTKLISGYSHAEQAVKDRYPEACRFPSVLPPLPDLSSKSLLVRRSVALRELTLEILFQVAVRL